MGKSPIIDCNASGSRGNISGVDYDKPLEPGGQVDVGIFDDGTMADAVGTLSGACSSTSTATATCKIDASTADSFDNLSLRLQGNNSLTVQNVNTALPLSVHFQLRLDAKLIPSQVSVFRWGAISVQLHVQGSEGETDASPDSSLFNQWSDSGFTSQMFDAAAGPLSGANQHWFFNLPYAVSDDNSTATAVEDSSLTIRCAQPLPSDWQQTFNDAMDRCRSTMDNVTLPGSSPPLLPNQMHILSGGDEIDGNCSPVVLNSATQKKECQPQATNPRDYRTAQARVDYFSKLSAAVRRTSAFPEALVAYSEMGLTLLADDYRIVHEGNVDMYQRTASNLSGVPYAGNGCSSSADVPCASHKHLWELLNRMGHMRRVGLNGNGARPGDTPIPYGNTMQGLAQAREEDPSVLYPPSDAQIRLAH